MPTPKKSATKKKPLSDARVREIALGIFKGELFTNLQIREGGKSMIPMIFMPISLMDAKAKRKFVASKPCLIWGNMKDTFSRSVNGYPIFTSFSYANREDAERIRIKHLEIKSAIEGVS
jgi:hypothetical protein